jgi:hypothetical protein
MRLWDHGGMSTDAPQNSSPTPAPIPPEDAAFLQRVYAPDQARLKALTGISWE